jgi:LacI family transcriptional regulator
MASIAAELGISRTAVSLVLKGAGDRYRISADTQARVRELSERLEYRPSALATALATGRTGVLGLIFPNVYESFMSEVVRGVEEVLHEAGAVMMLCTSGFDPAQELRNVRALVDREVDALIFVPYAPFRGEAHDSDAPFAVLRDAGLPTVCVDRVPPRWSGPAVVQDDRAAAARAALRLAGAGARRIAYVSFDLACSSLDDRRAGWADGLSAAGGARATSPPACGGSTACPPGSAPTPGSWRRAGWPSASARSRASWARALR